MRQHLLSKSRIHFKSIDIFPPFVTVSANLLILKGTEKLGYAFNKIDVWSILSHTGVSPFEANLMHFTLKSFIDSSKFHITIQCKVCFFIHEPVPQIQKFASPFKMANIFWEITTTTAQNQKLSASLRRERASFCGTHVLWPFLSRTHEIRFDIKEVLWNNTESLSEICNRYTQDLKQ